jgi:hypothetical protein
MLTFNQRELIHLMSLKRFVQVICSVLLALTFGMTGEAAAAPPVPHFEAQAMSAGLSRAQADWLQGNVDKYLSKMKGTQTSPNTIDLDGTGMVQIALPGEQHPRDFANPGSALADPCYPGTARGYVCAYSQQHGIGDRVAGYYCNRIYYLNKERFWTTGTGSWGSNQIGNVRGAFINVDGRVADYIPAQGNNHNYNWEEHQVDFFIPCGF